MCAVDATPKACITANNQMTGGFVGMIFGFFTALFGASLVVPSVLMKMSGNDPSKRYSENGETGYVAEKLSVYHCGDIYAWETAVSNAVDDMMNDAVSRRNILNPDLTHVSTGTLSS